MSDYHLHLHPHAPEPDSPPPGVYPPGWIDRYVEVALSHGVTELGFTEHLYRCVESEGVLEHWWKSDLSVPAHVRDEMDEVMRTERNLSLVRYVEVVLDAKARGLPVKLGLEVDFEPGTELRVLDLLAPYPWDFLIGSVHWIGAWDFTRAGGPAEFDRRGVDQAFREYFALEARLAAAGMVDVLAHTDIVKKWGKRPAAETLTELYQPMVAAAQASGVAVEVSSSTLRHPVAEITPAPALLRMFHAAGVTITLASDAHVPELAAHAHGQVVAAAQAAGYGEHLRFTARQPDLVPLLEVDD